MPESSINANTNLSGEYIFAPYVCLMLLYDGKMQSLNQLGLADYVESFDVKVEESAAATLTFTIHDPNFVLLNSSIITEETPVYFECAWLNDIQNKYTFSGYVSLVEPDFPESGYPTLTVTCMDETHVMNRVEKTRTFKNMKRSAIAKQIFKEYGFSCYVEDSGERSDDIEEEITQSNETDITFIQKLADEVIGAQFICFVSKGTGYFCKRDFNQEVSWDFNYRNANGNDVSHFSCSINKETIKRYKNQSDVIPATGEVETQKYDSVSETVSYSTGSTSKSTPA